MNYDLNMLEPHSLLITPRKHGLLLCYKTQNYK